MRVTSIQLDMRDRSKEEALRYALSALDRCPQSDLILLPEIWPSGFFCFDRYESDSESLNGPLVAALKNWVAARGCHLIMGSFVEQEGDRLYHTTLLLNPEGEILGNYRKIHLVGSRSRERKLLSPGTKVTVVQTPWGLAGLSTCYDLRFPEFFRTMGKLGMEILYL